MQSVIRSCFTGLHRLNNDIFPPTHLVRGLQGLSFCGFSLSPLDNLRPLPAERRARPVCVLFICRNYIDVSNILWNKLTPGIFGNVARGLGVFLCRDWLAASVLNLYYWTQKTLQMRHSVFPLLLVMFHQTLKLGT